MNAWYERVILLVALVVSIPVVFLAIALGPLELLGIPLVAIVAFLIYRRLRKTRLRGEPLDVAPRKGLPPPMPPVDADTLAAVPEPVTACPDCAFLGIRMPGIQDGLWPGGGELGDRIVCPRCSYQGIAVRFETRDEYGRFLTELARRPPAS